MQQEKGRTPRGSNKVKSHGGKSVGKTIELKRRRDSLISNNQNTAFLDSGASEHYIQEDAPVTRSNKQDPAILVGQPG
eukprot:9070858-Ditylum_brightwellii.AAC.1